jgi:hypothetical protein
MVFAILHIKEINLLKTHIWKIYKNHLKIYNHEKGGSL